MLSHTPTCFGKGTVPCEVFITHYDNLLKSLKNREADRCSWDDCAAASAEGHRLSVLAGRKLAELQVVRCGILKLQKNEMFFPVTLKLLLTLFTSSALYLVQHSFRPWFSIIAKVF